MLRFLARPFTSLPSIPTLSSLSSTRFLSSPAAAPLSSDAPPPPPPSQVRYGKIVKERYNKTPYPVKPPKFEPRSVLGRQTAIRVSPWKLNLIAKQVRKLSVPEAMLQLKFSIKAKAPLIRSVILKTSNLADIRYNLHPTQLEVSECFVTHGTHLKRMKMMGRGRTGMMHHRFAHLNVRIGEIDFDRKIDKATSANEKRKWRERKAAADLKAEESEAEVDMLKSFGAEREMQDLVKDGENMAEEIGFERGSGEVIDVEAKEKEEKK